MIVYVGTNTGPGKAEGIGVFRMDEETGALRHLQTVAAENPTFLSVHPNGRFLYAATRGRGGGSGAGGDSGQVRSFIEAFAIDRAAVTLAALNRQGSGGQSPAYVS